MSKSSQIEYSECMTLVTMVLTIYMCEYWEKNKYTLIQSIFFRVHIPFMPFILLSVSCQFPFTPFHVPSISVNHIFVLRSPYLISLIYFCSFMSWCSSGFPFRSSHFPSHLPFMSLSFYSLVTSVSFPFPSSDSIFLVCPVIFQNHIECPCIFVSNYVHGPWFFSWSSLLVYASGCQFIMW